MAWYRLTPLERRHESLKLWQFYLSVGGSLDPEPDPQSPFNAFLPRGSAPTYGGQARVFYGAPIHAPSNAEGRIGTCTTCNHRLKVPVRQQDEVAQVEAAGQASTAARSPVNNRPYDMARPARPVATAPTPSPVSAPRFENAPPVQLAYESEMGNNGNVYRPPPKTFDVAYAPPNPDVHRYRESSPTPPRPDTHTDPWIQNALQIPVSDFDGTLVGILRIVSGIWVLAAIIGPLMILHHASQPGMFGNRGASEADHAVALGVFLFCFTQSLLLVAGSQLLNLLSRSAP